MAATAAFTLGDMFNAWLLVILADFGDKTWALVVVLTAWCPWCGTRNGHSIGLMSTSYALIFMGTVAVLVLRTILLLFGVNPFKWDGFCEVSASVLVFLFAIKATVDYRLVVVDETYRRSDAPRSLSTAARPAITDDPEGYGAAVSSRGSPGVKTEKSILEEPPEGWTQALLTALLLPSLSVFFTEAGDRSEGTLNSGSALPLDVVLGAAAGFACSVAAAMAFSFILARQLAEQWLLFGINLVLWVVCFCSVRDAFVHLVLGGLPSLT